MRKWLLAIMMEALGAFTGETEESKSNIIKRLEGDIESLSGEREQHERDYDVARKESRKLKEEVEDLKLKKKISEEDIRHLVKVDQERKDIELDKERLVMEREKDAEILAVKEACAKEIKDVRDEYAGKQETTLQKQIDDGNKMYSELMTRLPNVNGMVNVGLGNLPSASDSDGGD